MATPPVGLFGKLPSHPDFIRLNAGGALPRVFDGWVAEGLQEMRRQIGNGWEAEFDRAIPFFFVFRAASPEVMVGVCRPGQDQSGRRYPFLIFAQATLDRGGSGVHLLPGGYGPFLRAARRLATSDCAGGIDNERAARVLGLSSAVPQNLVEIGHRFNQYLKDVTMESFWRGVFGDFRDRRKYLVIKNLFGALAPLRGHDPARISMVLRLPAATETEAANMQASIWFLICRAILGEKTMAQSVLFWHDELAAPNAGCYVSFRPPTPALLPMLFAFGGRADTVWDMERIGADKLDRAREDLGELIAAPLDAPSKPIQEFIQRI